MPPTSQQPTLRFYLVSDFNTANLAALMNRDTAVPRLAAECSPFGQVMQTLLKLHDSQGDDAPDGVLAWTLPGGVSPGFRRLVEGDAVAWSEVEAEVAAYCNALVALPRSVRFIIVPNWTIGASEGRRGLLDYRQTTGVSHTLARMNLALAEGLSGDPRAFVLDANRWFVALGSKAHTERLWYMSKTPFSSDLFKLAAAEIRAAVQALFGMSRKVLVLDLDNTLWGGIVGDVGWENLRIGGHDAVGEAYRDFQICLKGLKQRGILLAIASKNEEATALQAIAEHPEMVLRRDDFVAWRINWADKAQNVVDLGTELNLGLQSIVFLDDNPVERARVRESLPEVFVPEWPESPLLYRSALESLTCFDQVAVTTEDRARSEMYLAERKRRESRAQVTSLDAWLSSLAVVVHAVPLDSENLDRAVQLLNKTNQLNLRTRRATKEEFESWTRHRNHGFLTVRVADKFGDHGIVGLLGWDLRTAAQDLFVTDFVLSCRVMGRKIEDTMLHILSRAAEAAGMQRITAEYVPTSKNQPCLRFFQSCGLDCTDGRVFTIERQMPFPLPPTIKLQIPSFL